MAPETNVQGSPTPPTPSWPSPSALVAVSALSGAAIAGMVIHFASRGRLSSNQATNAAKAGASITLESLESSLRQASQGLESSLKAHQETVIQKSLHPVFAVQQQLTTLHGDVDGIKSMFNAPKTRGNYGEFQLESLIKNVMPATNFDFQYTLSNNKRVDCILHLPSPMGKVAIDSKFPFTTTEEESKIQKQSLKKHINDIATKYIVPGETADYAIMFVPSQSIFIQIVDEHPEIIFIANQKKVYVACPTTLMALLAQLHGASRGMAVQQESEQMSEHVKKLMENVDRLVKRFEKAEKISEQARDEHAKMETSIRKIHKHKSNLEASLGSSWLAAPTTTTTARDPPRENVLLRPNPTTLSVPTQQQQTNSTTTEELSPTKTNSNEEV